MINAIRKEVDRRQLEFVKSGKLVPLQFSSRHYDFKRNQWAFGKADDATIRKFLERKIYWQTKLRGGDVWLGDATEAEYLQTTADHLAEIANRMAAEGFIKLERRYATALQPLMARARSLSRRGRRRLRSWTTSTHLNADRVWSRQTLRAVSFDETAFCIGRFDLLIGGCSPVHARRGFLKVVGC